MTKSEYSGWSLTKLNDAITCGEGLLRKEGDRCFIVNRVELDNMRNERTSRLFGRK